MHIANAIRHVLENSHGERIRQQSFQILGLKKVIAIDDEKFSLENIFRFKERSGGTVRSDAST